MSFSAEIKEELMKIENMPDCCAHAMAYGMLLFGRNFDLNDISILTDNPLVGDRYAQMIEQVCGIKAEKQISDAGKVTCTVSDAKDRQKALACFSTTGNERVKRIERGNLLNECGDEDESISCCNAAFLRGAFIACGTASDPNKSYHIEFVVPYRTLSLDLLRILTDYGLKAKHMVRRYINVIYIKDSESIEDLLTIMGATNASLSIMNIKIYKDMRNRTNRINNFENANLSKTAFAAYEQINAIERLKASGKFEELSPDLKEVAELRVEYVEASLREIGEMCTPVLSRSAVNHRLKKLIALSNAENK